MVPICIDISDDIGVSWSAVYIMIEHVYTYPQSISVIIVKSFTSLNALLMRIPKPTKTVDKGTRYNNQSQGHIWACAESESSQSNFYLWIPSNSLFALKGK